MSTKNLFFLLSLSLFLACKAQSGKNQKKQHLYTNNLINESSPYLLQHAHNPVDWHPWGEAALEKAKAENKMLIISVGYAACHWCHVMEHESFEDTLVSRIMNENFINIKVDREERPDIDDIYMTACQMASGRNCGWPLNAFALPNGQPVWAGTYFPKKQWIETLNYFIKIDKEEPEKLKEYAEQLTQGIQSNNQVSLNPVKQDYTNKNLEKIAQNFLQNIDYKKGGRVGSPKFPMPNNYEFLLKYFHKTKQEKAFEAITTTLDNMAMGGIYDHLGGGFARYSTDANWKVPHFEKMLYDNGQLVSLYANAYQLTKKALYKEVIEETLEYIKREMTAPEGGFYSSLDADSEGEEGKFYVWDKSEIDSILADESVSTLFNEFYEVKKKGNWEHKNILYTKEKKEAFAAKKGLSLEEFESILSAAKTKLFDARSQRIRPGLDDKVLTSWNALMLKGYVDAYKALGTEAYLSIALKNAQFLIDNMLQNDYRLNRNYKDGKSVINAFLDDYAQLIQAFIALYEVTFDEKWLEKAKGLALYTFDNFFDEKSGMFNYTSKLDPPLIARKMEVSDNVIPASNSSIARGLYQLGLYLYKEDYLETARQMMDNLAESITTTDQPNFYSNWCQLYLDLANPPFEVAVVGENWPVIMEKLNQEFTPNALYLGGNTEGNLELLKGKLVEGETVIYVCQNKVCKLPVREAEAAIKLMND